MGTSVDPYSELFVYRTSLIFGYVYSTVLGVSQGENRVGELQNPCPTALEVSFSTRSNYTRTNCLSHLLQLYS